MWKDNLRFNWLVFVAVASTLITQQTVLADEYCINESFNVSCGADEIILLTSAVYGRMRSGRCIKLEYGHAGCMTDVTQHLDDACSAKQSCNFPVSGLLMVIKPCHVELMSYLDATYTCVKVPKSTCPSAGRVHLREQSGFLPVPSSFSVNAGSLHCPWQITVDPRQRVIFTIYTFGAASKTPVLCPLTMVFEDGVTTKEEKLCKSVNNRQTNLYTSRSNDVTAYVKYAGQSYDRTSLSTYLVYFEATGCPTIRPADDSWVKQDEATATVKCNKTDETWFLTCSGRHWKGDVGNCSELASEIDAKPSQSNRFMSYGLITAVIIGILLGVVIGAVPLGLAYLCLKRKWRKPPAGYVRDNIYDAGLNKAVDEEGHPIYPSLMQQHPQHPQILQDSQGRRFYPSSVGFYSTRYPPVSQCPAGHIQSQCPRWDAEVAGMTQFTERMTSDGGHSTDCLEHVPVGGPPRQEHVYETASFARGRSSSSDHLGERQLPVYYEVDGKVVQTSKNVLL